MNKSPGSPRRGAARRRMDGNGTRAGQSFTKRGLRILLGLVIVVSLAAAATIYASVHLPSPAISSKATEATGTPEPAASSATAQTRMSELPGQNASQSPSGKALADESPVPKRSVAAPATQAAPTAAGLETQINRIISANSRYQLGVALVDVSDGVVHQYGIRGKFVAASTGKILAAAAYYHLAEAGLVSLAAPMGSSTAAVQIQQMIQQSNNQSWALIVGVIGYQGLHDYAASIGIPYDRAQNTLSTDETARILALLYTGRLLNGLHTAQLLSYMQHTNYETLIPAAVPSGISVFHKYGQLQGYLHDASILVQGGHAYVFIVYTLGQSTADIPARTWIIHQLTQAVVAGLFSASQ